MNSLSQSCYLPIIPIITDVNGHEPADDDTGPRERYRLAFLEAPDNLAELRKEERVEKVAGFV